MNRFYTQLVTVVLFLLLLIGSGTKVAAQSPLNKVVSVVAAKKPLTRVLKDMEKDGDFYFSYNSSILPGDSLVTATFTNKPVKQILDHLLGTKWQYKESGNHIIIQLSQIVKYYTLSGYVRDSETGEAVTDASVYDKQQFVATLTNGQGYFRLKLRERTSGLLNVSKLGYADTTLTINAENENTITISPKTFELDTFTVFRDSLADRSWFGRLLVSSRLRMQSRNLSNYLVSLPVQVSLTPGLSTHGRLSSQAVNKYSFNLMGGYSAGLDGIELAGFFNINRRNAQYVQLAGFFNIVGGNFRGVQAAGIYNQIQGTLTGVQLAASTNIVINGPVNGVQAAGVVNISSSTHTGSQLAGVINIADSLKKGVQVAGVINIAQDQLEGAQIAGVINIAGKVRGVQIGIINIADSSSGYSIGFLNLVKKGKSTVSLYSTDIALINIAAKTGNNKLYSILFGGVNPTPYYTDYTFGLGIGREFILNKRLSLATELSTQDMFRGDKNSQPEIYRLQTAFNARLGNHFTISAGPAFNISRTEKRFAPAVERKALGNNYPGFQLSDRSRGWLGWQVSISWNYAKLLWE